MKRVVVFLRKKTEGLNSIEELAYTIFQYIENVDIVVLPYSCRSISGMFLNILYAIKKQGDINHVLSPSENYILPFLRGSKITTIHDVGTILSSPSKVIRSFRKFTSLTFPLFFVHKIICISNYTKQELLAMYKKHSKKTYVIYNPYNPAFTFSSKIFNTECPMILHIGTATRKNLLRVIEALLGVHCKLWIVGKLNEEQMNALNHCRIDYINEVDVPFDRIVQLYNQCDIVSFPSLYEGFGMPIIEANATGRVVLTSKKSSIPEVAGDAAYYIDPLSVDSIRKGFLNLITDKDLRERLIENGGRNVLRFCIDEVVASYRSLYNHC